MATQKKAPAKKAPAKKASKKTPAMKPAATAKKKAKAAAKTPPKKGAKVAARPVARRADFGAPIDAFFAKQPPATRPILDALRAMVEEAAPKATATLKWGMPFYELGGETLCAIAGFKAHVNLILPGPPGTYADPDGLLEGDGKTGRHLKLRAIEDLPRAAVRGWLRTAVARAS